MRSPTKLGVRGQDKWGDGAYGTGRGTKLHKGSDYIVLPGASIYAPISGTLVREARPYAEGDYSGCLIQGKNMAVKMFYFKLLPNIIGTFVREGAVIGMAQDISGKYPGMTPHIHMEVESINPEIFTEILS